MSRTKRDAAESRTNAAEALRELVARSGGQRLPSERDLSLQLGISRPALRSQLALLQQEGLVEARPKSGTYAVDRRPNRLQRIVLLIDAELKLGDDPFIVSFVDALQRTIQSANARCVIERAFADGPRPPLEDGALTLGLAGQALIAGQRADDPPMVGLLLDAPTAARRASIFQLDDRMAGDTAARLLLERGCRSLVFLGRRDIPASRERLTGAEAAAAEAGARFRFHSCHLNYAEGLRLGREGDWHPGTDGPLGIITTNDWLALGLRTGLRDRLDRAEQDIPIASFDGLPVTADPSLGITSLGVPIAEIATDAVAELERLQRSPGASGRLIRYTLQVRAPYASHSTATA